MTDRSYFHRERRRLRAKSLHRWKPPETKAPPPHHHVLDCYSEYDMTYRCRCGYKLGAAAAEVLGYTPWARFRNYKP